MSSEHTAGVRPPWVDDVMFPFRSRFVELDGNIVHYIDEGSGPILLMLHGNPTWSFEYRRVIRSLRNGFRCIALDYPGFGLSVAAPGYSYQPAAHADVVLAFCDRMDLSNVTLVGHDWGGPIGLFAAEQRPDRFERLVLTNTWAWPLNGDLRIEMASRVMGGRIGRALIGRFNLFVNALIPLGHRRRKVSRAEMAHYRAAMASPEHRNASAILPGAILGSSEFLAEIEGNLWLLEKLPTLIVWANRDIGFGERDRQRLEKEFPNHRTVIVEGAGHYVASDAADELSQVIRDWWSD